MGGRARTIALGDDVPYISFFCRISPPYSDVNLHPERGCRGKRRQKRRKKGGKKRKIARTLRTNEVEKKEVAKLV